MKDEELRTTDGWRRVRFGAALVLMTLREIFDENAYTRFLERQNLAASRDSYRAFLQENAARRERRPRCC